MTISGLGRCYHLEGLKIYIGFGELAHGGIGATDDPIAAVIRFCDRGVKDFLKTFPDCNTLTEFLDCVAVKLGTVFEIVTMDEDLQQIQKRYVLKGEKIFAGLDKELSEDVFAITYRQNNREGWELEFVSVIDARGATLTDQLRLSFRRTHIAKNFNSPEEALMEVIAGHFGFYGPFIKPRIGRMISFEAIEALRRELCPETSQQSALIGIVKAWPQPCLLVNARLATKKVSTLQRELFSSGGSAASLRAVHVTVNESAREEGLSIFENMRVPETSIIYRVFQGMPHGEAIENLSSWETSKGFTLADRLVEVKARRSWESVDALIVPTISRPTKKRSK